MKKTTKRNLLTLGVAAFACTLGVGAAVVNTVNASAETLGVTDNFYMTDGASIRIKGDEAPSGIRWKATVTQAYYNQITENGTKAVTFGTYVDNAEIDETETSTRIDIACSATPTFTDGAWSFYASITYDDLKTRLETKYAEDPDKDAKVEAGLTAAYEAELYARSYVTVDETTTLAESADTGRSIKDVAAYCLIADTEDVTSSNEEAFIKYAGGEYTLDKTQTFNNTNAYNTTSKSGEVTAQLADGDYDAYFGAKYLGKATASNGAVSLKVTGLGEMQAVAGEMGTVYFVDAAKKATAVPFISATQVITDRTEFTDFLNSYNAEQGNGSVDTTGWYVILTDDIDFENNTYGMAGASFWKGTFNGLGHSVSNIRLWGQGGLLGRPAADGVFENTAFLNIKATVADCYLLTGYAQGGIVRNVYLQGEFTAATTHGAMRNEGSGTVENVIVNAQFADGSTAPMFSKKGSVVLKQAYAIGNATAYVEGDTTTPVYTNESEFLMAKGASITAENGWNGYWSFDTYTLSFGGKVVLENKTTKDTIYTDTDTTISPTALVGGAVEKVLLNDTEITVAENEAFTVEVSKYTAGEVNTLKVYGDGKIVEQPFVACTYVIDTYKEFQSVMSTVNKTDHDSSGWYIVLGKDIDASDGTTNDETNYMESNAAKTFEGTFNGLGHTVANLWIRGQGGIFGRLSGATIENVAFVGFKKESTSGYIFNNYVHGTSYVKNVYLEGYSAGAECVFRGGSTLYTSNVVVSVKYVADYDKAKYVYDTDYTYSWASQCFAIGNFAGFHKASNGTVSGTVYANTTAFATTDNLATITAANGWNMDCWSVSNGVLYFGNRAVQDVTYTTYGQVKLS